MLFASGGNLLEKQGKDLKANAESAKELSRRREAQLEAQLDTELPTGEVLTFSPDDKGKSAWFRRTAGEKNILLGTLRDEIFGNIKLLRHHKVLVLGNDKGLLAWEASRRTPEGGVFVLMEKNEDMDYFKTYPSVLTQVERPCTIFGTLESFIQNHDMKFDFIIGRNVTTRLDKKDCFAGIHKLLENNGTTVLSEIVPSQCTRLSQLVASKLTEKERKLFVELENRLYSESPLMSWKHDELVKTAAGAGFLVQSHIKELGEKRYITIKDVENWFNTEKIGTYGKVLSTHLELMEKIKSAVFGNIPPSFF